MSYPEDIIRCDGCGVELFWAPVIAGQRRYCCQDCAEDRPCDCGERQDLEDDRRSPGAPSLEA
jgi:hypothetical protein